MTTPSKAASRVMTLEEWGALDEDVEGELVDGRLEEEEQVTFSHDLVIAFLTAALRAWLAPNGGFVLGGTAKFAVAAGRGRKPDLVVYLPGTERPAPDAALAWRPPDIAVEVVSPSPADIRRDRVAKLREYAAFGVRWYWIVDPAIRTFEILELDAAKRYVHLVAATTGTVEVPGMSTLVLDIDAMWSEVDRFAPPDTSGAT